MAFDMGRTLSSFEEISRIKRAVSLLAKMPVVHLYSPENLRNYWLVNDKITASS